MIFMAISLKSLPGMSPIDDAPDDGTQYVRQNGIWIEKNTLVKDAKDVERNSQVGFKWNAGSAGTVGSFTAPATDPDFLEFNSTDANGNEINLSTLNGLEADVFYNGGNTRIRVMLEYKSNGLLGWTGIDVSASSIEIVPYGPDFYEPLSDGDVLVYQGDVDKFKPVKIAQEVRKWDLISGNYQLSDGDRIIVDTSSSNITVVLPEDPFLEISIKRLGAGTVTINRNGHLLDGIQADYVMELDGQMVSLSSAGDLGVVFTSGLGGTVATEKSRIEIDPETGDIQVIYI